MIGCDRRRLPLPVIACPPVQAGGMKARLPRLGVGTRGFVGFAHSQLLCGAAANEYGAEQLVHSFGDETAIGIRVSPILALVGRSRAFGARLCAAGSIVGR